MVSEAVCCGDGKRRSLFWRAALSVLRRDSADTVNSASVSPDEGAADAIFCWEEPTTTTTAAPKYPPREDGPTLEPGQDRGAWVAVVWDAIVAIDIDTTTPNDAGATAPR